MPLRLVLVGLGVLVLSLACAAEQEVAGATDEAANVDTTVLWRYDVDMDQFMASMRATEESGVPRDLDMSEVRKFAQERETFITELIKHIRARELETPFKEAVLASGYESYADWERDGNGVYQAVAVISFSKAEPEAYQEIRQASPAELEILLQGPAEEAQMVALVSRVPVAFVEAVRPHYEYLVIDRPDTSAADASARIEDYERAIATMIVFRSGDPVPQLTAEERAEYEAAINQGYKMAALMDYYDRYYPGVPELWAATLSDYGFYDLGHWVETIDRMLMGVVLVQVKKNRPDVYQAMQDNPDDDYESLSEEERAFMHVMHTFEDSEITFIEENMGRVFEAITF